MLRRVAVLLLILAKLFAFCFQGDPPSNNSQALTSLGLTVLPAVTVAAELSQGRLLKLPWSGPDLTVITHMVWHKDKWLAPALSAFLSLAREILTTREGDEIPH